MSKSPYKQYTKTLEQSRTVKKEDQISYNYANNYDRYDYSKRKPDIDRFNDDFKVKLQLALKHNTRLLDQNASLSSMSNDLRCQLSNAEEQIRLLKNHADQFLRNSAKQRQTLLMQNQIKNKSHEEQLKKLLNQISNLHQEKNNIEIQNSKQLQKLKGQFEKSLITQLQNLRNIQNNSKQLYQTQIRGLKEQVKKAEYQVQNIQSIQRLEKNRLKDQISAVENEMKHIKQKYQVQLKETQRSFENQLTSQKRRFQNDKETEVNSYTLKLKRMKKELLQKVQDLQTINKKMIHQEETYQLQSMHFRKQKQNWLAELSGNQINSKTILMKEKTKLEELAKLEIQNLTNLYDTNIQQLQSEVNRLRLLIDCKTQQIRDVYDQNSRIKQSFQSEINHLQNENNQLKNQMKKYELQHKQESEAMKIKLSQLIETNLKQISEYFQNELSNASLNNRQLQKINQNLKDRIYKLIEQNDELRKNFEIQNSKQKARIQDLKIKLASINLQNKEHIQSLSSKVQLTSQTLIRQGDTKQRAKAFYDEQKRKFHHMANSKDQQIASMMEMLQNVKVMHQDQLKVIRAQKDGFRQQIQQLQKDKQKIKQTLQMELKNKDQKLKSMIFDNEKEMSEIRALQAKIDELQKENLKLQKRVDHLTLTGQALAQELGLKKGFIQTLQLQSNAAIQQQKNKIRVLMGAHQVSLKQFFEEKVKSKDKDIEKLQKLLSQKQEDIRDLIVKYNALQKRLDMMMEANDKLSQFEEKVKCLGLDNNLVKNMAELFQRRKQ